ncbi:MAG: prepilin-type N-terminal cleavage/methylation domain-containing protein [Pedobacter sp.]
MFLNNRGFSLLEVLLAVVILSVGLLGVAGLQATAINGNLHGSTVSQATVLAEDVIERVRMTDYDLVTPTNFPETEDNVDGSIFSRTIQIEDNVPSNELKRVTVTVSWSLSTQHRVVLRTIISDEG